MDILGEKRVGGEIVEQGWIVSVPWGIVPRGDLLLQRRGGEKECHEKFSLRILQSSSRIKDFKTVITKKRLKCKSGELSLGETHCCRGGQRRRSVMRIFQG